MTDPIVDAVCAKLQSRSAVGIKKYGTTLDDNQATVKEKLVHIQEELMDGANYIEWLLQNNVMQPPKISLASAMFRKNNDGTTEYIKSSDIYFKEKEMTQKLGCAADDDDLCFPCRANGWVCEKAKERADKMPTPMNEYEEFSRYVDVAVENSKMRYGYGYGDWLPERRIVETIKSALLYNSGRFVRKDVYETIDTFLNKALHRNDGFVGLSEKVVNKIKSLIRVEQMPTPMTIEMEADGRQAALDDFEIGVKKVLWSRDSYEKFEIDDFFDYDTIRTIRAALQSPRVQWIDGLDEAINPGRPWAAVNNDTGVIAVPMKDFQSLQKAARAYAELSKTKEPSSAPPQKGV